MAVGFGVACSAWQKPAAAHADIREVMVIVIIAIDLLCNAVNPVNMALF